MQGCVYRCDIAGKSYIGKTSGKLEYRVSVHLYDANVKKAKNHFAQALCGIDETEVRNSFCAIETINGETWEELEARLVERENYWIDKLNTIWPGGYNSLHSKPARKSGTVVHQPPRKAVMREIICLDTNEIFPSLSVASRAYGVSTTAICRCLKGKSNTASGMHWKYTDEEYHKSALREGNKNHPSFSKPVICRQTGIEYPSAAEAQRATGIDKAHILRCAKGEHLNAGGYKWGFIVNGKPVYPNREDENKRRIKCIETGEEYESITEAAKIICPDVSPSSLGSAIRRGHRYRGKHYAYIDR